MFAATAAKLLYASEAEYVSDKAWDPWFAYLIWNKDRSYRETIALDGPFKKGNVLKVAVAAMPLYEAPETILHEFLEPVRDYQFEPDAPTTHSAA